MYSIFRVYFFCIVIAAILLINLTSGDKIKSKKVDSIVQLLEKEIVKKYGSDDKDQFSDSVTQSVKGNRIEYFGGDKKQPVFICSKAKADQKVIVLEKGSDYMALENKNTFVVLRKQNKGKLYNVHTALVFEITKNNTVVIFDDGRIEQIGESPGVLKLMGNRNLPRHHKNDPRPRCEWLASVLFCISKTTVPSPKRKFPTQLTTMQPPPRGTPEPDPTPDEESSEELLVDSGSATNGGTNGSGDKGDKDKDSEDKDKGDKSSGDKNKGDKEKDSGDSSEKSSESESSSTDSDGKSSSPGSGDKKATTKSKDNKESEERYITVKGGDEAKTEEKGRSSHKKPKAGRSHSVPINKQKSKKQ